MDHSAKNKVVILTRSANNDILVQVSVIPYRHDKSITLYRVELALSDSVSCLTVLITELSSLLYLNIMFQIDDLYYSLFRRMSHTITASLRTFTTLNRRTRLDERLLTLRTRLAPITNSKIRHVHSRTIHK